MTVEMTVDEAQLLIAVLTFAEGAALAGNPSMVLAITELHSWRSALLQTYLQQRIAICDKER